MKQVDCSFIALMFESWANICIQNKILKSLLGFQDIQQFYRPLHVMARDKLADLIAFYFIFR